MSAQMVNTPEVSEGAPGPLRPPMRSMSPLGQFSLRYCYSCTNPSGGEKPCKQDWVQCHAYLSLQAQRELIDETRNNTVKLGELIDCVNSVCCEIQHLGEHLIGLFNPQALQKVQGAPIQQQQSMSQNQQIMHQPQQLPQSVSVEAQQKRSPPSSSETFVFKDGLTWALGKTSTGKACEKLYRHRNQTQRGIQFYTNTAERIEQELCKKEAGEKYNLGWEGYFWYKSQDTIPEPFIGRMVQGQKKC